MKEEKKDFWKLPSVIEFTKKSKTSLWVTGIFLLAVYGIKVFNVSISHDTEAIMAVADNLYNSWYMMGRFGLIFLKKLLGTYLFNPFIASFFMFVTMIANSFLWSYLFYWLGAKQEKGIRNNWIFPVVFFTSMIMAEQSGFLLQAYEVNIALLLLALALIVIYEVILEKRRWYMYFPAVICCVLAFSTYQSLVPLFMTGAAVCFLLVYDKCAEQDEAGAGMKFYWGIIGKLIAVFVFSFGVYQVVNKIVLSVLGIETTPYITEQVMWGNASVAECVSDIIEHIKEVLLGDGLFFTEAMGIIYVIVLIYSIARIREKKKCYFMYLLALAFCMISPFLMTLLLGTAPMIRVEIMIPFVTGFFIQYMVNTLSPDSGKIMKGAYVAAVTVVFFFSMYQSLLSARLYYTQYVQYEEDVRLAVKITDRIDQLDCGEEPEESVVFVGSRMPQRNEVCIADEELELIGKSFFEMSFSTNHGTWVMNHFLDTLGYSYEMPEAEDIAVAEEAAQNMPSWPDSGSVAMKNGVIIVKLG